MQKVVKAIELEGYEPPAEIIKLVNDVIVYQIDTLDKILKVKLQ